MLNKTFSHGRGATTYYFGVAPGAIPGGADRLTVSGGLYHRTPIGAKVCAEVSPGRLGWPWYEVKACA